jgi:hypothetical protein
MRFRTATMTWALVSVILLVLGVAFDMGLAVAPVLCVPLVIASIQLCHSLDRDEALGLRSTLLIAFTVRCIAAAVIEFIVYRGDNRGLFAPDELGYDAIASYLARNVTGNELPLPGTESIPAPGLVWMITGCYYLLGHHPIVPKFINCLLGSWSVVLTVLLAARLFPATAARRAGLVAAIFPSLVLWSSLLVKDGWTLLGAQITLLAFVGLVTNVKSVHLAIFALGLGLIAVNRPYEVVFVGFAITASLPFVRSTGSHPAKKILFLAALSVIFFLVSARAGAGSQLIGDETLLERINSIRDAYTVGANSAIDLSLVDTSTPLGLLLWVPIGLFYFFFAPFPFTGTSSLSLFTSPEMIWWYLALPSLYRGGRALLRSRSPATWPILFYVATASIGWSIAVTNVGTIYRYRAQVMFLPLVLIAADQVRRRQAKAERRRAMAHRVTPLAGTPSTTS